MNLDLYFSLLLVGLLGSTHCIGMCGGLQQLFINMAPSRAPIYVWIYQLGRLLSYLLITFIVSSMLNRFATQTEGLIPYATTIRLVAAIVMIWIGLNHFVRIPLPAHFTIATQQLWTAMRRIAQPILPPKNIGQVLLVGMVWGWIPCSLVYSALAIALSANDTAASMLAMLCFGLGTMPALIGMGLLGNSLRQNPAYKRLFAALLIAIGVYALIAVLI